MIRAKTPTSAAKRFRVIQERARGDVVGLRLPSTVVPPTQRLSGTQLEGRRVIGSIFLF